MTMKVEHVIGKVTLTSIAQVTEFQSLIRAHFRQEAVIELHEQVPVVRVLPTRHAGATAVRKGWVTYLILKLVRQFPGLCKAKLVQLPQACEIKTSTWDSAWRRLRSQGWIRCDEADNEGRGGNYITDEGERRFVELASLYSDDAMPTPPSNALGQADDALKLARDSTIDDILVRLKDGPVARDIILGMYENKSSASSMVWRIKKKGLIVEGPDKTFTITDFGRERVARIRGGANGTAHH
jgi:DNA-binding PadR family transcriptional regulator